MKLFTKDINQKLFAQYRIGSNLNEQNVVAKIFNPYGVGRWYLLNSDPNDPDYLWAIVQMGDVVEVGSVLRSELETIRVKPFGLPLERDMYFSDRNAMEVLDGLEKGKTFAHGGMTAGRYYKDNSGNEFRFIGESEGKLLFKDGEKIVTKSEEDFEDAPKEKKLFGIFAEGGEMEEGVDLFEDYDDIPANVQKILQKYDFEEGDYRTLEKAKKDVEKVGYTFEYSLDGTAYDLRKIGQKGKSEDEYAEGGQTDIEAMRKEIDNRNMTIRFKIATIIGLDKALEYLDKDYVISPFRLIEAAVSKKFITIDEIDEKLWDAARYEADDVDSYYRGSGEGIGSSDVNAFVSNMLNSAGIKVGVVDNRYTRMADGGEIAAAEHNIKQAKYGAKMSESDKLKDYTKMKDSELLALNKKLLTEVKPIPLSLIKELNKRGLKKSYIGTFNSNMSKGGKIVGKQKNLDVNKNGKLDADDFKMLRGEKMADGGTIKDYLSSRGAMNEHTDSFDNALTKKDVIEFIKLSKDSDKKYWIRDSNGFSKFLYKGQLRANDSVEGIFKATKIGVDRLNDSLKYRIMEEELFGYEKEQVPYLDQNQNLKEIPKNSINKDWSKYVNDNSGYLKIEEETEDTIQLATRKNGNVGDEEYSQKDVQEAKDVYNKIKEKYPNTKAKLYNVDEWVYLELTYIDKMAMGGMSDTMEQVMTFEEFKKKLPILHDVKAGDNGVEYKPKYNKYSGTIMYFKHGRTNSEKVSLSEAYKYYKYFAEKGEEYAMGGKFKFEDKVKSIKESLLKRKKVSPKVQKDYGKTYDRKEALEAAKRIVGAQTAKYELKKKFKEGGKTIAQTPAPKKDRVFGSTKNKAGSASSKKTASNIELNESIVKTLGEKAKNYNEKHSSKVSTSTLKAVMRRGMGAYSTSHRPTITGGAPNSRQAWGFARVNKFLLKKGGTKVKAAYVQDDDLMENGGEVKKIMRVSEQPKFKKLQELQNKISYSQSIARDYEKWREGIGANYENKWNKMIKRLRGWNDYSFMEERKTKPEWKEYCKENSLNENYDFGDVLA